MNTPAGKIPFPRLTAWQGDPGAVYIYSGIRNVPKPWTPTVLSLKTKAEAAAQTAFNSVLINRYRTGRTAWAGTPTRSANSGRNR